MFFLPTGQAGWFFSGVYPDKIGAKKRTFKKIISGVYPDTYQD
jgi:hypothetical protein